MIILYHLAIGVHIGLVVNHLHIMTVLLIFQSITTLSVYAIYAFVLMLLFYSVSCMFSLSICYATLLSFTFVKL